MMKHEQNSRFVLCETSRGTLGVEVVAQDILCVFLGRETQNYFSKAVEADRRTAPLPSRKRAIRW